MRRRRARVGLAGLPLLVAVGLGTAACAEDSTGHLSIIGTQRTCSKAGVCATGPAADATYQIYRDGLKTVSGTLDENGAAALDVPAGSYQATLSIGGETSDLTGSPTVAISGGDAAELTLELDAG